MISTRNSSQRLETAALLELVAAAALWGLGFIATLWTLRSLGPLGITGFRMGYAFLIGLVVCLLVPSLRRQMSWSQLRLAFWPGLFLCLTMVLQTWGLAYTTVTKSSFITTLYVLMVPIMERVLLGRRIPRYHMIYVAVALIGMGLICDIGQALSSKAVSQDPKAAWNIGDWITLACAVAASLQIVWFGKIQTRIGSSFVFNTFQTFWTGLVPFVLMFVFEKVTFRLEGLPLLGMIELAIGSTLIAFSLQVRAQKKLSPSVSSLVYLLESPFATVFGFFILSERPTPQTITGAVIVLVALGLSTFVSREAEAAPDDAAAS